MSFINNVKQRYSLRNLLLSLGRGLRGGVVFIILLSSCARMGSPDGGWYDETPPRVIGATPAERETGVTSKRISIYFDEYVKMENASEKVVVSPPQMEQPEIKTMGKRIAINLIDSLKPGITYTIDFSDAIVDNNEGNPMGNYTYSFSTGDQIDTLECSGYVLNAEDLEPVKGILVGLFDTVKTDTAKVFMRVSRTDSEGHFVIRGIAPGTYTVGALQDMDGNYRFSQRAEVMAFSHDLILPSSFADIRQDTVWADELHIKDIMRVPYTHFMPDNIVLRSFTHNMTERFFTKYERLEPDHFSLYFTAPIYSDSLRRFEGQNVSDMPRLRLLNAPEGADVSDWYVHEHHSLSADTLTYWLRDTALVNTDTLLVEMTTLLTDTLGMLQISTDTLEILPKVSLAKRMKQQKSDEEEWRKNVQKRIKEREKMLARMETEEERMMVPEVDTIMPPAKLKPKYGIEQSMSPDGSIYMSFPVPLARIDSSAIHLYVEQDSLWFRAPFTLHTTDSMPTRRNWEIYSEWIPGAKYSFEVDTLAFEDIYGHTSDPYKTGISIKELHDYASLFVEVSHSQKTDSGTVIVQLLNSNDAPVRKAKAVNGTAELYYIAPGKYYLRAFIDRNDNGRWDVGDFASDLPPEEVYYYPEEIECKAKWDYTKSWNLTARPLNQQKPSDIIKQKKDKKKTIKNRNAERAKEKGIPLPM